MYGCSSLPTHMSAVEKNKWMYHDFVCLLCLVREKKVTENCHDRSTHKRATTGGRHMWKDKVVISFKSAQT